MTVREGVATRARRIIRIGGAEQSSLQLHHEDLRFDRQAELRRRSGFEPSRGTRQHLGGQVRPVRHTQSGKEALMGSAVEGLGKSLLSPVVWGAVGSEVLRSRQLGIDGID
jgi:hypothetical protein